MGIECFVGGRPGGVRVDGSRLFVNYLGYLFALDMKSGKMLWRSAAFHHVEVPAMQNVSAVHRPGRYTIMASGEYLSGAFRAT